MAYEPIHHKYRPQTFKDLVGQETIALTLSNALIQEKIATAYLFTGPRGTGKTSSARILAKSLNCLNSSKPTPEPCGKCEVCVAIAKGSALDVMEIDAASNTGVDNIREIIERSRFAPVQCRYKIYAIDECHMLSTAAFNALLKTLEEPPPQVVFILATTDPQRVLSTIISRCQRFDYRRIPLPEMVSHLKYIAEAEKIAIADDALTLIAQIANGGLRDAESLLDQLSLLPETISVEKVWDLVGAVPEQDLLKLIQLINNNDSVGVLEQCRGLLDRGREPIVVLQNLASFYLNLLIAKTAPQRPDMVAVTETCWQQLCQESDHWDTSLILRGQQHLKEAENQLKRTTQPRLWLEVTLLGLLPQAHQIVAENQSTNVVEIPLPNIAQVTTEKPPRNNLPQQHTPTVEKVEVVKTSSPSPAKPQEETDQALPISKTPPVEPPIKPPIKQIVESVAEKVVEAPQVNINNTDMEEIWGKVLGCLQPPTTQALLKQQCHLISFDGSSAIVGISSATLQKLNQGKVPNIEKAFAQVVQNRVKVQLEVASRQNNSNSAKKNSKPPSNTVSSLPQKPKTVKNDFNSENNSHKIEKKDGNSAIEKAAISPKPIDTTLSTTTPTTNTLGQPIQERTLPNFPDNNPLPQDNKEANSHNLSPPSMEGNLDSNYEDNDLDKAIALLTQSFEGELVQMDNNLNPGVDTLETAQTEETSLNSNEQSRPKEEEYEDDW